MTTDADRLQFIKELDGREGANLSGGELDVMHRTRFWENHEEPLSSPLRVFIDRMMEKHRHPLESARQALLENSRCRNYEALALAAYNYGSSFSKWKTLQLRGRFVDGLTDGAG